MAPLPRLLDRARDRSDAVALHTPEGTFTYGDLLHFAAQVGHRLAGLRHPQLTTTGGRPVRYEATSEARSAFDEADRLMR